MIVEFDGDIDDEQIAQVLDKIGSRLHAAIGWDKPGRPHVTVTLTADGPMGAAADAVRDVAAVVGRDARAFEVLPTADFDAGYRRSDLEV